MTTKTDYTPEEWKTLLIATVYTSMLVIIADPNLGFFKELAALSQAMMLSATGSKSELVRSLAEDFNKKETQEAIKPELEKEKGQQDPDVLKQTLLGNVRSAADLVSEHSPDEGIIYRRWLLYLAQQTAEGSKEGGFLGIGAVRVSDREKDMLAELSLALGMDATTEPPQ